MPKAVSCGFILFDRSTGKVLGCRPTGDNSEDPEMSFDIPKGHQEPGEDPLTTAKRELREETGIDLPDSVPVHEIGHVPYQKTKSLHLFSAAISGLEDGIDTLHCDSTFEDSFGNTKPEVSLFAMTDYADWFFKNLQPHVRQEMARARLPEPVYVFVATREDGSEARFAAQMSSTKHGTAMDMLDMINDRNVHPHGYTWYFQGESGEELEIDLESVRIALLDPVMVDVDGSVSALPDFPLDDFFRAATSPERD
jgi:8-oxo-dGTP pyrophosphatase MutT (NUDIX family)